MTCPALFSLLLLVVVPVKPVTESPIMYPLYQSPVTVRVSHLWSGCVCTVPATHYSLVCFACLPDCSFYTAMVCWFYLFGCLLALRCFDLLVTTCSLPSACFLYAALVCYTLTFFTFFHVSVSVCSRLFPVLLFFACCHLHFPSLCLQLLLLPVY